MTDIRKTANEQLRQATWWGGAGQALPEFYVEQLITEIDRLNKVVEQLRQSNGALTSRVETLKSGQSPDPVKMNLLAEVQRLTGENIELGRKAEARKGGIDILTLAISRAVSLPAERWDEINGILTDAEALSATEK